MIAGVLVGAGLLAGVVALLQQNNSEIDASPTTTQITATTSPTTAAPESTQLSAVTTAPSATTTSPSDMGSAELASRFGDAVWKVEVEGCGFVGSGSAFAISPKYLVTNQHVIDIDERPTLVSRRGETRSGRVVGASFSPDVAVIEVDGTLDVTLDWAPTASVSEGDRIVTIGYPAPGGDFTVTPGNVLSFGSEGGYRNFIRTDGQLDYGNSGGPALNSTGGVVGVATSLEANPGGAQVVPQIFASDILRPVVEAMIESPSYPTFGCAAVDYEPEPSDYTEFWTVIVASLPTTEYDYDGAYDRALDFFVETGFWADVLLSDLYPSLNPGYWAVYTGYFVTQSEADAHCDLIKSMGYDCYPRHVGWSYGE